MLIFSRAINMPTSIAADSDSPPAEPSAPAVANTESAQLPNTISQTENIEADARLLFPQIWRKLITKIQTDPNEEFSDFGDTPSDTTSFGSSVLNYTYENGRRYHAYRAGQYVSSNKTRRRGRGNLIVERG